MFLINGNPLPVDTPFTDAVGNQYPANWLRYATAEEKAAIGITETDDAPSYDDRFYWGVGIPKDLDQLKTQFVAQVKQTAGQMLSATDWMVIRNYERGINIPSNVVSYRASVVAKTEELEGRINAVTTVEELASIQFDWPEPV